MLHIIVSATASTHRFHRKAGKDVQPVVHVISNGVTSKIHSALEIHQVRKNIQNGSPENMVMTWRLMTPKQPLTTVATPINTVTSATRLNRTCPPRHQ